MDMIDRYIYAVTRRLPPKQRADIERELRSLIEDMLSARTGDAKPTDKDIEAVLLEIGEPWKVAANYSNAKQYLISPELYGAYTLVLCVVLACVGFGITVAMVIGVISNSQNIFYVFAQWLATLFNGLLCGFGGVTIAFAVIERVGDLSADSHRIADEIRRGFQKGMDRVHESYHEHRAQQWQPRDLPHVPREDTHIRPSEPIFAIAFTMIWLGVINFAPWVLGVHTVTNSQYSFIPFFDLEVLKNYLVFINALGLFGIAIETAKLFTGTWNVLISLLKIGHNVLSALLFINMFTNPALIDGSFFTRTGQAFDFGADAATVMSLMDTVFFKALFFIVLLGLLIDSITTLYKGIRGSVRA